GCARRCERAHRPPGHQAEWHSQGALPHCIGYEAKAFSIPGVGERARSLEHFAFDDTFVATGEVERLRHPVRPLHAQHIGLEVQAQSKVSYPICGDARLIYLAGANLQSRTDAERVVLAAAVAEAFELDVQREVVVSKIVAQETRRPRS